MREFQEKRKMRKIFFSAGAIVLLSAVAVFLLVSTTKVYIKNREASSLNSEAENELLELKMRKAELEAEIAKLRTKSGIEEEMRKKFNVSKPGEEVLVIVDKKDGSGEADSVEQPPGFFARIWQAIKNIF